MGKGSKKKKSRRPRRTATASKVANAGTAVIATAALPAVDLSNIDYEHCADCSKSLLPFSSWEHCAHLKLLPCCGNYLCPACDTKRYTFHKVRPLLTSLFEPSERHSLESKMMRCPVCKKRLNKEKEAYSNLQGLAQSGHVDAEFRWGMIYGEPEAILSAAGKGHPMANVSASLDLCEEGPLSFREVEQYLKAAGSKCAPASYQLGLLHRRGLGVKESEDKAAKYIQAAAEQFFAPAVLDYGFQLEESGRLRDAIIWYERLAVITSHGRNKSDFLDATACIGQWQFLAGKALMKTHDAENMPRAYFWLHCALSLSDLYNKDAADLISEIETTYGTKCANCQAPKPKFACAHCGLFMYCNKDCRRKHREGHHRGCRDTMKNLENSIEVVCDFCTALNPSFQCAECNEACYCDEICQKLHWVVGHKNECRCSEIK